MDLQTLGLTRAQRQVLAAYHPMDICLVQGGWASGKTLTSVYLTLHLAMSNANTTGLIVAPQIKTLRDDIAPLMLRLLQPHRYRYNQQTRVFTFPNGSRIYLRGLKNCDAISPDFIWLEHAEHATADQFKQLLRQLKPGDAHSQRVWLTCRPVPKDHWLTQYFSADTAKPCRRVILHTQDNPMLNCHNLKNNTALHPKLAHIRLTHTVEEQQALFSGLHASEPALPESAYPPLPQRIKQVLRASPHTVMVSNGVHLPVAYWQWPRLGKRYAPTLDKASSSLPDQADPFIQFNTVDHCLKIATI
jgi:Phage terminase large subunit